MPTAARWPAFLSPPQTPSTRLLQAPGLQIKGGELSVQRKQKASGGKEEVKLERGMRWGEESREQYRGLRAWGEQSREEIPAQGTTSPSSGRGEKAARLQADQADQADGSRFTGQLLLWASLSPLPSSLPPLQVPSRHWPGPHPGGTRLGTCLELQAWHLPSCRSPVSWAPRGNFEWRGM